MDSVDRLLQNANFPNFYVGKVNLILGIPHVCLRSNLFSALNLKKFSFRNTLSNEMDKLIKDLPAPQLLKGKKKVNFDVTIHLPLNLKKLDIINSGS